MNYSAISRRTIALVETILIATLGACGPSQSATSGTPAAASATNGLLYLQGDTSQTVGIQQTTLFGLDAATGAQTWAVPLDGIAQTAPLLIGEKLYINTEDSTVSGANMQSMIDHLSILDARSGQILKQFDTANMEYNQLYAAGQILIGVSSSLTPATTTPSMQMMGIDPSTNNILWEHPISNSEQVVVTGDAVVQLSALPVSTANPTSASTITAYRVSDGQQMWSHAAAPNVFSIAANTKTIVEGILDPPDMFSERPPIGITALNLTNGDPLWSVAFNAGGYVVGVSDTKAIVDVVAHTSAHGDKVNGSLVALDLGTSTQRWTEPFEVSVPLVNMGKTAYGLYSPFTQGNNNGITHIFALNSATGATEWNMALSAQEGAVALVASSSMVFAVLSTASGLVLQAVNAANGAQQWQFPLLGIAQANLISG